MTVPCPGARTKRQGQRETIAAGGVSLSARRGPPGFAVLRSNMCDPLSEFCRFLGELRRDAESRVNILGVNCHAYLFTLDDSLVPHEARHQSFPARD
jgi:hypothetical protein